MRDTRRHPVLEVDRAALGKPTLLQRTLSGKAIRDANPSVEEEMSKCP
jgi:hypothetical protein